MDGFLCLAPCNCNYTVLADKSQSHILIGTTYREKYVDNHRPTLAPTCTPIHESAAHWDWM